MATISYWSTLFLCLFFINNNPQVNHRMKLNQNLQTVVQYIKAIQTHCKEKNINLKDFLSEKELKEYQSDVAFVKKYAPEIKADALIRKKKGDPTKDITKPSFVEALIQWKELIEGVFKDLSEQYKGVQLDVTSFDKKLVASSIPITNALLEDWKSLLKTLPKDSTTAEIIFAKLSESKIIASFTLKNEKQLEKIYNKAANKYKALENDIKKFQIDILPNKALFIRAIEASSNSEDVNLPKNKAEAEKAKIEAEKAKAEMEKVKAAEKKELLDLFKVWKKEFSAEMSREDTLHDKNLVSLGKLKKNLKVALGYTEMYTKPIIDALSIQLKEKAFAAGDSITVKELKKHLVGIILTLDNHINWKWQMELWRANNRGFMFPIPPAIHMAITDSELNVSEERFMELVREMIYSENLSIIDTIAQHKKWEKVNDAREVTFDGAILKSEFQIALSKKVQSITPLEFVYNELAANLKDGTISLDNFKLIWEKSMQESYKQTKGGSDSVYTEWVANQTLWKVEQALDSLTAFFPNEAVITAILEEARIVPNRKIMPKLHQYGNGHVIDFNCSIAWNPVESIFEVAGKEAANQSMLTKLTERLKSLGKGVELVIEELEDVGGPLRLNIANLTFDVKIPMKLTQQFNSEGEKFVAAVPNNLDSSYIKFHGDSNYFGIDILRIEPLTELPVFDKKNVYNQDASISMQDIKLTVEVLDPQIAVNLGAVGGVELTKHPAKYTIDLVFTIYSSYNFKENLVSTNINDVKGIKRTGGGKIIKNIKITKKEPLKLEVFKK